jgi:TolB-like protein/tetratricopeptide (TPR) repeat protein
MPSILPTFEYDIFISYRHNDNRSGWVTDFVNALQEELAGTIKEPLTIYFDKNPHDGLLETHSVDKSLEGKLKCLIFIPIVSQTYCDTKCFAWQHEFIPFNTMAKQDALGRDIKLHNGNVASRILPIKIHDLDTEDKALLESEINGVLRAIEFIFKSAGVNRPLRATEDRPNDNLNKTYYRDQVNKVANAIKEIIAAIKNPITSSTGPSRPFAVQLPEAKSHKKRKAFFLSVSFFLILIVGSYFLFPKFYSVPKTEAVLDKSIAVLPFVNMSNDPDQEYFSDGLTEAIITQLAKIRSFKVISRTSVMQYKKNPKPLIEVGKELGVSVIVEGSVQRSGDQVQITAQLINAETDEHLWAETYERPLKDIFVIQREVATAIAAVMKQTLSSTETNSLNQAQTSNTQAYDLYLRGKFVMEVRQRESIREARTYFEKAVALDPNFAKAYSGLADICLIQTNRGFDDPNIVMPLAKKYIDTALELDPNSAETFASLGYWYTNSFNFKEAKKMLAKSLQINPNQDNAYNWAALNLTYMGNENEALKMFERGIEINPSFDLLKDNMITRLMVVDPNRAIQITKEMIEVTNEVAIKRKLFNGLSRIYWNLEKKEEAISAAIQGENKGLIQFYKEGKNNLLVEEVEAIKRVAIERGEYFSPIRMGGSYASAGARNQAIEFFNKGIAAKDPALLNLLTDDIFLIPKSDPLWKEFRNKARALIDYDWPEDK